MTKVDAVKEVLTAHGGKADWGTIYQEIDTFYPEVEKTYNEHAADMVLTETAKAGIRGVVYREIRNERSFTKKDGIVSLAKEAYGQEDI